MWIALYIICGIAANLLVWWYGYKAEGKDYLKLGDFVAILPITLLWPIVAIMMVIMVIDKYGKTNIIDLRKMFGERRED